VVGVPGRVVGEHKIEKTDLDHAKLPDPITEILKTILKEQSKLAEKINVIDNMDKVYSRIDEYFEKKKEEMKKQFSVESKTEGE